MFSTVLLARSTHQRPLVSSVAMAYALFLPLGAAGYGLTSGAPLPWYNGMVVFLIGLAVAALLGAITLVILGLRPLNGLSYLFTGAYMTIVVTALVIWLSGGIPTIQLPEMTPAQLPQAPAQFPLALNPAPPLPSLRQPLRSALPLPSPLRQPPRARSSPPTPRR